MSVACYPEREVLRPLAADLFSLVLENATAEQWECWLRVPLEHAAARGNGDAFKKLRSAGADMSVGWRGCRDRPLLHAAAEGGDDMVVSTLLSGGAQEDLTVVSGPERTTALHRAIASGHEAAAVKLLLAGAPNDLADSRKRTPLHLAAEQGHTQVAYNLLFNGASTDSRDLDRRTPLHIAAKFGHVQIVRNLVLKGANINALDFGYSTPIHLAANFGHPAVAEALLLVGADANLRNNDDHLSAVHVAAEFGKVDVLKTLLQYGGDVHSPSASGSTALHMAAGKNRVDVIRILVDDAGADIEAENGIPCCTPLHHAAGSASCDAALALLERGANVGAQATGGESPLHVVVKSSQESLAGNIYNTVDILLRWGADEKATTISGKTPEDYVNEAHHSKPWAGRVSTLLRNAPTDRVWRRRGWLIMLRARRGDRVLVAEKNSDAMPARRHDSRDSLVRNIKTKVGVGNSTVPFDECPGTDEWAGLVWWVLGLRAKSVFRKIVEFV